MQSKDSLQRSSKPKRTREPKKHSRVGASSVTAKGTTWLDKAIDMFSDYFYSYSYGYSRYYKRSGERNSRKNARECLYLSSLVSKLPARHLSLLASERPFVVPKYHKRAQSDSIVRLNCKYYINLIQFASASLTNPASHPYITPKKSIKGLKQSLNPIELGLSSLLNNTGLNEAFKANLADAANLARTSSDTPLAIAKDVPDLSACNNRTSLSTPARIVPDVSAAAKDVPDLSTHARTEPAFYVCKNCANDLYHALFGKPRHVIEPLTPGTQLDPFAPEQACDDAKCRVKELLKLKPLETFADIYLAHLDLFEALIRDAAQASQRPTTLLNKAEARLMKHTLNRFSLIMQAILHKCLSSDKPFDALENFVNLFTTAETSMRTAFLLYISDANETAKAYQTAQFRHNLLEHDKETPSFATELAAIVSANCAPDYKNCILHLINTNMNVLKTYYYEGLSAKTNALIPFMFKHDTQEAHSRLCKQYKHSKLSANYGPKQLNKHLESLKYNNLNTLELYVISSVSRQKLISLMAKVPLVHPSVSTLVEYPDAVAYTYAFIKGYREPYHTESVTAKSVAKGHYTALTSFMSKKSLESTELKHKHFNDFQEMYVGGDYTDGFHTDKELKRAYESVSVTATLAASVLNNLQSKWAWRKLAKGMEAYSPDLELLAEELNHLHPLHKSLYTDLRDAPTSYERFDSVASKEDFLSKLHARTNWAIAEVELEHTRLQLYKTLALALCECVAAGLEVPDIYALMQPKLNPTAPIITQVQKGYFTKINVKELKKMFMLGTWSYDTIIELYARFKTALAVYLVRKRLLSLKQLQELSSEFTKHVAATHVRKRLSALAKMDNIAYTLNRATTQSNDGGFLIDIEPLNVNELLHHSQAFCFDNSSSNEVDVYARHQNLIAAILKHRSADSTLNLQLNKSSRSDAQKTLESSALTIETLLTSSAYLNKYQCYPIKLELISEPLKRHLNNHFKGILERAKDVRESVRAQFGEAALNNPYQVNAKETDDGLLVTDFESVLQFEEWLTSLLRRKVSAHMKKLNLDNFQIE